MGSGPDLQTLPLEFNIHFTHNTYIAYIENKQQPQTQYAI